MKKLLRNKRGGITIAELPTAVILIGLVFLVMATVALVAHEFGEAVDANSVAYNVTLALQKEIGDNTDIAGVVLTIILVGAVLTILIGIFMGVGGARRI